MSDIILRPRAVRRPKKRAISIELRVFFFILILFPFIQQRTMEELPNFIVLLYRAGAVIASSVIYLDFLLKRRLRPRAEILLFALFWFIYIVSTALHCPENLPWVLYNVFTMFALTLFIFVNIRRYPMDLLKALTIIYSVFITLNWALDIVFPHGLYKVSEGSYHTAHLLGDDNAIVYVALPGLIVSTSYSIIKNKKISWFCYFMMLITEYTLIRVWSASAMLVVAVFVGLSVYVTKVQGINYRVLVITLVAALLMAFFGLSSAWFQNIVVNYLHKSVTLSGRTIVWEKALEMIKDQPFLGYGGYYQFGRFAVNVRRTYSSHTPYLQMLVDGGILLLLAFVFISGASFSRMRKQKKNLIMYILGIGAMCMMINYITEQVTFYHLFIIFSLMINIDYIPSVRRSDLKYKVHVKMAKTKRIRNGKNHTVSQKLPA